MAYNSLFLSHFGTPDWDMFQSTHPDAELHAAARAISGGPVYVSDAPDAHSAALLRSLVLPDGSVLRCEHGAKPTRQSLFDDPNADGTFRRPAYFEQVPAGVVAADGGDRGSSTINASRKATVAYPTIKPPLIRTSDVLNL